MQHVPFAVQLDSRWLAILLSRGRIERGTIYSPVSFYGYRYSSSLVFVSPSDDTILSESPSSSILLGVTELPEDSEVLPSAIMSSSMELDVNEITLPAWL
jgi:hypothetical protein